MNPVKVILKGEAHRNFDKIHHFLENDKLTITLRTVTFPEEIMRNERLLREGDVMTLLHIVGSSEAETYHLVCTGVENINSYLNGDYATILKN